MKNNKNEQNKAAITRYFYRAFAAVRCDDAPLTPKHNVWEYQPSPLLFAAACDSAVNVYCVK